MILVGGIQAVLNPVLLARSLQKGPESVISLWITGGRNSNLN